MSPQVLIAARCRCRRWRCSAPGSLCRAPLLPGRLVGHKRAMQHQVVVAGVLVAAAAATTTTAQQVAAQLVLRQLGREP